MLTHLALVHLVNCYVIFHRVNKLQSTYRFSCWWTFSSFPAFGSCRPCCGGHCHTRLLGLMCSSVLGVSRGGGHLVQGSSSEPSCRAVHAHNPPPPTRLWVRPPLLPPPLLAALGSVPLNFFQPAGCEMASHCGFNLRSSDYQWGGASFHMFIGHLKFCSYSLPPPHFIKVMRIQAPGSRWKQHCPPTSPSLTFCPLFWGQWYRKTD